jgi:hypothetical protein
MSVPTRYRDLPIRQKLHLIIMLTVGAALTVACGVIAFYQYYTLRDSLRRDLGVLSENIGDKSTAAFREAAGELLSGLRAKRSIVPPLSIQPMELSSLATSAIWPLKLLRAAKSLRSFKSMRCGPCSRTTGSAYFSEFSSNNS